MTHLRLLSRRECTVGGVICFLGARGLASESGQAGRLGHLETVEEEEDDDDDDERSVNNVSPFVCCARTLADRFLTQSCGYVYVCVKSCVCACCAREFIVDGGHHPLWIRQR